MNLWTNLFIVITTFFLINLFKTIFIRKNRKETQQKNQKLGTMRKSDLTSLESQKEFIETKFPRGEPWKFSWKWLRNFITQIAIFIAIMYTVKWLWKTYVGIELQMWTVMLYFILFPLISNWILKKWNLQGNDISVFFK